MLREGRMNPVGLLTVLTEGYERVSMHGVRRELVEEQAKALGLPLHVVYLPKQCSNEEYERRMGETVRCFLERGIRGWVFGDVWLEEVRKYREEKLLAGGAIGYFPLWGKGSNRLMGEFLSAGFRAVVVCVDGRVLSPSFLGREVDRDFLGELPASVDLAGERGEYHCFVWDGPIFKHPVLFEKGEIVRRGNFYFCDLLPI